MSTTSVDFRGLTYATQAEAEAALAGTSDKFAFALDTKATVRSASGTVYVVPYVEPYVPVVDGTPTPTPFNPADLYARATDLQRQIDLLFTKAAQLPGGGGVYSQIQHSEELDGGAERDQVWFGYYSPFTIEDTGNVIAGDPSVFQDGHIGLIPAGKVGSDKKIYGRISIDPDNGTWKINLFRDVDQVEYTYDAEGLIADTTGGTTVQIYMTSGRLEIPLEDITDSGTYPKGTYNFVFECRSYGVFGAPVPSNFWTLGAQAKINMQVLATGSAIPHNFEVKVYLLDTVLLSFIHTIQPFGGFEYTGARASNLSIEGLAAGNDTVFYCRMTKPYDGTPGLKAYASSGDRDTDTDALWEAVLDYANGQYDLTGADYTGKITMRMPVSGDDSTEDFEITCKASSVHNFDTVITKTASATALTTLNINGVGVLDSVIRESETEYEFADADFIPRVSIKVLDTDFGGSFETLTAQVILSPAAGA